MCAVVAVPVNKEIVEECCLAAELRLDDTLNFSKTFNLELGRTVHRQEILLVGTVEDIAETVLNSKVLVDAIARSYVDVELRHHSEVSRKD